MDLWLKQVPAQGCCCVTVLAPADDSSCMHRAVHMLTMEHIGVMVILLCKGGGACHAVGRRVYEELFQTFLGFSCWLQSKQRGKCRLYLQWFAPRGLILQQHTVLQTQLGLSGTLRVQRFSTVHQRMQQHCTPENATAEQPCTCAQGLIKHEQQPVLGLAWFWQT